MTEEEFYNENKFKIKENDVSTWKYIPLGELKRKIYDYHFLPLQQFLNIYYKEYLNKEQWSSQWMDAIVYPAYQNDLAKLSKRLGVGIKDIFTHNHMIEFYNEIKYIRFFDDDVKLFFSWLCGMNFFVSQNISFEDWINSNCYNIGGRHEVESDIYSLQDMVKEEFGNNLVRDKLMILEWYKR